MGNRFDPRHAEKLLHPDRQEMLPAKDVLRRLDVESAHAIADVGCGPGYFTIPLAQITRGTVYAVDVSREMLDILARRAREAGVEGIERIQAPAEQIPLSDAAVDRVFCAFVLHEVDDLDRVLAEFHRLLQPGGRLMILEWEKRPMDMGPPMEERIEAAELETRVKTAGFRTEVWRPNPYQYGIVAQRNPLA
ncbi:MAG: methyltransferase domain-containing protein [Alicyclobacillus sp.]|nr:methyltransferase domain-containing protein [Alicyclobacillus sp.]